MKAHQLTRRGLLVGVLACTFIAGSAWGGSYLRRASILLDGAELEAKRLRARLHDKELARVIHKLAAARATAGREMLVPKEVKAAHPHLLLVLESYERAADAAVRRDHEDFLVALARAREEAAIFIAVLKQGGWTLP